MTPPLDLPPILVVDDDPDARMLIERFLKQLHLANPVLEAADGDEAVATLLELTADEETASSMAPALVLLDGELPTRRGIEVLAWIKDQAVLAGVPVVMLTGRSEVDAINHAYALGAASYLVKPVGFEALGEVLRRLDISWAILPPTRR